MTASPSSYPSTPPLAPGHFPPPSLSPLTVTEEAHDLLDMENLLESYFMLADSTNQRLDSIGESERHEPCLAPCEQPPFHPPALTLYPPLLIFHLPLTCIPPPGEYIDDTEDLINIQLDYSRNKVIDWLVGWFTARLGWTARLAKAILFWGHLTSPLPTSSLLSVTHSSLLFPSPQLIRFEIMLTTGSFAIAMFNAVAGMLGENLALPDLITAVRGRGRRGRTREEDAGDGRPLLWSRVSPCCLLAEDPPHLFPSNSFVNPRA
jgi:hypothetical protein